MAADAQMHPDDLVSVARPVARGDVDYVKGDRFGDPNVRRIMPRARHLVGRVLSWLTRRAAGLAHLSDSQCGYTAISSRALAALALEQLFPRYGYPNDLVGMLALAGFSIRDVPVRPVYRDEMSGVRPWHVLVIIGLIFRIAVRRALRSRSEGSRDQSKAVLGPISRARPVVDIAVKLGETRGSTPRPSDDPVDVAQGMLEIEAVPELALR
jgi:hypothetical protein